MRARGRYALAKKLSWKVRKNCGWSSRSSRTYWFVDDMDDFISPYRRQRPLSSSTAPTRCSVCNKAASFSKSIRQTFESCDVMSIAREELVDHQEKEELNSDGIRLSSITVNSSCYSSLDGFN
ncbi:unnamed protein product [Peronospora destructor]|uniref:Uncharacterized protein n=1 Tax=Peronospora destructor TaxID=86335 RepID=A0AAV0TGX4_9STRA|nr:unnamed protein product [Peronospora destructor]